jgi:cytochrome P450
LNAHNEHDELLGNKELRDVVLNFIIAGRDTTGKIIKK